MKLAVVVMLLGVCSRSVVIVDSKTGESLVGVGVVCGRDTLFSDMDGCVSVGIGVDSVCVSYVSYEGGMVEVRDTVRMVVVK